MHFVAIACWVGGRERRGRAQVDVARWRELKILPLDVGIQTNGTRPYLDSLVPVVHLGPLSRNEQPPGAGTEWLFITGPPIKVLLTRPSWRGSCLWRQGRLREGRQRDPLPTAPPGRAHRHPDAG